MSSEDIRATKAQKGVVDEDVSLNPRPSPDIMVFEIYEELHCKEKNGKANKGTFDNRRN